MKRISTIWIAVAVIVAIAIATLLLSQDKKKENINFNLSEVKDTTLLNTVTATGTIEPVTSVTVGTQVSGIVSKVYVDYNSVVKKGQVIAELDKTNLTKVSHLPFYWLSRIIKHCNILIDILLTFRK